MKDKNKILTLSVFAASALLVGCTSNEKHTEIEDALYTALTPAELVKVVETDSDRTIKDKTLKDVEITINLEGLSKSIAYEQCLEKVSSVLGTVDYILGEDVVNNYVFKVNTSKLDVYGNKQKVKVIEVSIDKNTVDKINFEHFDYKNLDKIAKVKQFKYLTEKEA